MYWKLKFYIKINDDKESPVLTEELWNLQFRLGLNAFLACGLGHLFLGSAGVPWAPGLTQEYWVFTWQFANIIIVGSTKFYSFIFIAPLSKFLRLDRSIFLFKPFAQA